MTRSDTAGSAGQARREAPGNRSEPGISRARRAADAPARPLLRCCIMSTKSKRRSARRAGHENTNTSEQAQSPATREEREAIGAVMGALLGAITFGAVEEAPRSHRQP